MSKYDDLDARTELEQTIAADLSAGLGKRGFQVRHNGTDTSHAPSGKPDIVARNGNVIFTFETTKSKGAAQDRELNSIRDHLNEVKAANAGKRCFCIFIAPETSRRMLDGVSDHNNQRASEELPDMRILPLCFETLELYLTRLIESEADLYPVADFLRLFSHHAQFVDDLRIKKLLYQEVFPLDVELAEQIEAEEVERDQRTFATLIRDLAKMEDYMRQNGIAVGHAAIDTLIQLVFLKLYEEKREQAGLTNRLRSVEAFNEYRSNSVSEPDRRAKRAIHNLFNDIKVEAQFLDSGMFTRGDSFVDTLTDDFITEHVIPMFEQYRFLGTKIDALGAVYEVLALRAEKDVKVGQFFTPQNIVRFMVELAALDPHDYVLDPACGTGRFLIHAMADMIEKAKKSQERNKRALIEHISKHQLFGADIDNRIAKIAKMNMWIHGDGKANIFGGSDYNGLTLHRHSFNGHDTFDNAFDAVLTNPPLGELNYQVIPFADEPDSGTPDADLIALRRKFERMPILPRRNVTQAKLDDVNARLEKHREELAQMEQEQVETEWSPEVQEWLTLEANATTKGQRARKRELKETDAVKAYLNLRSNIKRKERTVAQNEGKKAGLEAQIRAERSEWEITGNTMKGGAMFLAAIWHYLKNVSNPDAPPEWRGGRVLIILDEGILNTDNYADVRDFIRERFYIKAVISLTRDTFVPISKTSTKTSILYAVKKTDPHAVQREPIFFAHVARVGMDTKGNYCPNELTAIGERYHAFKTAVLNSYVGLEFRRDKFAQQLLEQGTIQ